MQLFTWNENILCSFLLTGQMIALSYSVALFAAQVLKSCLQLSGVNMIFSVHHGKLGFLDNFDMKLRLNTSNQISWAEFLGKVKNCCWNNTYEYLMEFQEGRKRIFPVTRFCQASNIFLCSYPQSVSLSRTSIGWGVLKYILKHEADLITRFY